MQLYALKVNKSNSALIARLNGGVKPEVEKKPTYFIFDADDQLPNDIITERLFSETFEVSVRSPMLLKLKK